MSGDWTLRLRLHQPCKSILQFHGLVSSRVFPRSARTCLGTNGNLISLPCSFFETATLRIKFPFRGDFASLCSSKNLNYPPTNASVQSGFVKCLFLFRVVVQQTATIHTDKTGATCSIESQHIHLNIFLLSQTFLG